MRRPDVIGVPQSVSAEAYRALQSEQSFQKQVVDAAMRLGWKVFAVRQSAVKDESGEVVSVVTSEGWPDLVLAKDGRIIIWELKSARGRLSAEQKEWMAALAGPDQTPEVVSLGCVRPNDWDEMERTLRGTQ